MALRPAALLWVAAPLALAAGVVAAGPGAAGTRARVAITVWQTPPPPQGQLQLQLQGQLPSGFGGATYGGTAPTGALVNEQRDVDVPASGDLRVAGVAATLDPASVQLRAAADPTLAISEQRFLQGAATPTEFLARHVGDTVTVVTAKGEVTGVLRAVDEQALALETGAGVQVMRREGYVQDVRVPAGSGAADRPSLVWRVTTTRPGKQAVDLTYRATGMVWVPDYVAVLDEAAGTIDFSARATIRNATGATFDDAELTLVGTAPLGRTATPPPRFVVPTRVHLGAGEVVQVDLVPPHATTKARQVVTYQSITDAVATVVVSQDVQMDCAQLATAGGAGGRAELGMEVDVANQATLPDGRARLFRRGSKPGDRVDVISEDTLRAAPGIARVRIASADSITGERKQIACTNDEVKHRLEEKIEVTVSNKGPRAQDVVVRELVWRMPIWRIDPASESTKGTRAGGNAEEYRVRVPASGAQKIAYTVVYSW